MNSLLKTVTTKVAAVSLLLLSTISAATDGVMIAQESAWARATPPGSKTTAIYLTMMNHGGTDINLTSATADISDQVELHTHTNNDGVMKMQQVASITVPTGGQANLKPHGDHIMVFNLQDQLKAGDEISVELTFNDGSTKTLTIPVHKESPMPGSGSGSGDAMKHDGQHDGHHKPTDKKESDDAHQHNKAS